MQDMWRQFAQTGSVADYLKYKEQERQQALDSCAHNAFIGYENYNQGACDKGTNKRGRVIV
jgi:hypothetical protein